MTPNIIYDFVVGNWDGMSSIERGRGLRAIREVPALRMRVSGAEKPVVAFAMVREMRDNKRGICGGSREGVTAAILMAAAQEAGA